MYQVNSMSEVKFQMIIVMYQNTSAITFHNMVCQRLNFKWSQSCIRIRQRSSFKWPIRDMLTKSFGIEHHIGLQLSIELLNMNERL